MVFEGTSDRAPLCRLPHHPCTLAKLSTLFNMLRNITHGRFVTQTILLVPSYRINQNLFPLPLTLLIQILHDREASPAPDHKTYIDRVPLRPARGLNHRENGDGVEREYCPACCQHAADGDGAGFSVVAQRHVDEGHEDRGYGCGDAEEVVTCDLTDQYAVLGKSR